MSRFRSLSALSMPFILAAGIIAVAGSTPDAAAAPPAKAAPIASYQVTIPHEDGDMAITALAWNHEVIMVGGTSSGGGQATGKRQHKPFVITKELDKSSPILMKALTTGEHLQELKLDAYRTRGGKSENYLTITLENVQITSFQTSGDAGTKGSPVEQEHVAFTFQKITWNYRALGEEFVDDLAAQ